MRTVFLKSYFSDGKLLINGYFSVLFMMESGALKAVKKISVVMGWFTLEEASWNMPSQEKAFGMFVQNTCMEKYKEVPKD